MFKFFLKKNFCDVWDNLFYLILTNIVPLAVIVLSYFAIIPSQKINSFMPYGVFVLASGVLSWVTFSWGANARKIADFNSPSWRLFLSSLKTSFLPGFFFGILISVLIVVCSIAIPYYLNYFSKGNIIGLLFVAIIAWFLIIATAALQWFIPLYYLQEQNNFLKCLKKSFIIFFDNALFSFAMLLHNALLLALTILTFGLIPGLNGIVLSSTNALRLRLYKYDWYEENPDLLNDKDARSEVPWDSLIAEDREMLGPRKLSSFLFPWK